MPAFKKGDRVRYIPPVIEGTIVQAGVTDDAQLMLLVDTIDASGQHQQHWLRPEQLQAAPVDADPAAAPTAA